MKKIILCSVAFLFLATLNFSCRKKLVIPTMHVSKQYTSGNGLLAVKFWNSQQGVASGKNGTLLVTHDGGETWAQAALGSNVLCYFDCISLPAKDTGFVSGRAFNGSNGFLLKTTDGGSTWTTINGGPGFAISYFPTTKVGYFTEYGNYMEKTTNGGSSWKYGKLPVYRL